MRRVLTLALLMACNRGTPVSGTAGSEESIPTDGADTQVEAPVNTDALHGTAPEVALGLPEFAARNADDSPRGPDDLRGHPTVLWFFPATGTPG